jgi:DNA-binding transcriptional LysR family regulator
VELRQIEAFLAVVEHGGFRRAAAKTYVSQPALSAQVRDLERALGHSLFVRTPAGVELTDAGRAVVPQAERALSAIRAARRLAAAAGFRGHVVIGCMPGGAGPLTRPLLTELAHRFPHVRFHLQPIGFERWHPGILHEVDLFIGSGPWPSEEHLATDLVTCPYLVAFPRRWRRAADRRRGLPNGDFTATTMPTELCLSMPMPNAVGRQHRAFVEFWSTAGLADLDSVRLAGPSVGDPLETLTVLQGGHCAAIGPAWARRTFPTADYRFATVDGPPASTRLLSAQLAHPLLTALHQEAADIVDEHRHWTGLWAAPRS